MAMDYAKLGIRVNAICPGFIDTPMLSATLGHHFMADYKAAVLRETKLGRFGRPEDIAGAALFFASDDVAFVTGQALAVDGGYTSGHGHGLVDLMVLV
jgi:NAD(P)-dependent dehydrogenase (short-subunit alcohol dehydrogenase family)